MFIFIFGSPRCGKSTLAKLISDRKDYVLISGDDIVEELSNSSPELGIHHGGDDYITAERLAPHLIKRLANFTPSQNIIFEGTHIDFEQLMPFISSLENKRLIGLTFGNATPAEIFDAIRSHDTAEDWTNDQSDADLRADTKYFIENNRFFLENFQKYGFEIYDSFSARSATFSEILSTL